LGVEWIKGFFMVSLLMFSLLAAVPEVGSTAPDFTAVDTDGKSHTLSEMVKKGPVVVAFFPKAFTGGCTKELKAYRDRYEELSVTGGQILAVSMDSLEKQKSFKADLKAPYPFIADSEGKLVKLFDVKKVLLPIPNRYTFVIGPSMKILAVQSDSDAVDPTAAINACQLQKKEK
jgi:thioredoxin-dependent peroxiredoxin